MPTPRTDRATAASPIVGGGVAGDLVRAFDWATTALGPTDGWPASLMALVRTMLRTSQPTSLFWGSQLVNLYNDGFIPLLGEKHPRAMGQRAEECWSDAWPVVGALLNDVVANGKAFLFEEMLVPIVRNGALEDAWWNYSYSPAFDDAGDVAGILVVATEVTAAVRARQALETEVARTESAWRELQGVFAVAPGPICVLRGPELRFELANEMYMRLVGRRELLGRPMRDALPELAGQGFFELLDGVYTKGEPFVGKEIPARLARLDGETLDDAVVDFVYQPLRGTDGVVTGILVFAADVTEPVRARQALEAALAATAQAAQKSEAASLAKDEFLAMASHELRTPLNAILGWGRLLVLGQLDAGSRTKAAETIARNARAQVRLIEDILDGSRIISGKLRLEIRALDLTAVVTSAIDAIRPAAEAKNIAITISLDPDAARTVGDPDRLQQVVWNLANNAVKFTPKGGAVDVRLEREGTHISLSVTDSGKGISREFLPHVFERFRQAEGSTTRRFGGLGLGLALVRHLVEAHGGSVRAESEGENRGARFVVLLPVQAVYAEQPQAAARAPTPTSPRQASASVLVDATVLVVDDEADARDLVAATFRASGAEVATAHSVDAALEYLATHVPALIVSDVGMPVTDGYELIRRVRRLGGIAASIPAIALTAYSREQDRRLALEAGFQTHVTKPVDPSDLIDVAAGILQFVSHQRSPEAREVALQRADTLLKFQRILVTQGLHDALHFLNSRTPHRFTGIYRFDPPTLKNVALVDSYDQAVQKGDDPPLAETYCSIVGESQQAFATEDTRHDDRLRSHPARETMISYCGVLLRDETGAPYGTLCHFDLVPCEIPSAEIPLMEVAAAFVAQAIANGKDRAD